MIVCEMIALQYKREIIGTLKIYMEGSGDPKDAHQVRGVALAGTTIGDVPDKVADKQVPGGKIILDI